MRCLSVVRIHVSPAVSTKVASGITSSIAILGRGVDEAEGDVFEAVGVASAFQSIDTILTPVNINTLAGRPHWRNRKSRSNESLPEMHFVQIGVI